MPSIGRFALTLVDCLDHSSLPWLTVFSCARRGHASPRQRSPLASCRVSSPAVAVEMGFGDKGKKEKAAEKASAAEEARQQQIDDASWAEGGKKANKKKEAEQEKAAARAERKVAADEQAAEEEAELSKPKAKKGDKKAGAPKLTRAEIAARAMAAAKEKEATKKKEEKEIAASGGNEYIGVLMENDNKKTGIDASGIDDALTALDIATSGGGGSSGGDGKKVNVKLLYKAYEEAEIARLKADNPGLKLSQLKERAFENWKKSPENPANQTPQEIS